MIGPDTTRCHACGRRYEFTNHKDRCPVCCPKEEPEEMFEDYELSDEVYDDDGVCQHSCRLSLRSLV
jgi:hypothetical protein